MVTKYTEWHTPATDYPRVRLGSMRVKSYQYKKGCYHMNGLLDSVLFQVVKPIIITDLQEYINGRWKTWMVDDPPHWEAMKFYAKEARGRVLTTGLGLGLVIHLLADNPKVESITVVERSTDVIGLMHDLIPSCNIVNKDFYHFMEETDLRFDTCIIDLWTTAIAPKRELFGNAFETRRMVDKRWPYALTFLHGFIPLCDKVWPMSQQTRDDLTRLAREENALSNL